MGKRTHREGILHGEPRGEVVVGRPLKFGEEMRRLGSKSRFAKTSSSIAVQVSSALRDRITCVSLSIEIWTRRALHRARYGLRGDRTSGCSRIPERPRPSHEKWGWMVYWVGGRQFACEFGSVAGRQAALRGTPPAVALSATPTAFWSCAPEYPAAILPGYYSDGRTWISIDLDADLPGSLVLDLCDTSYALVFAKLPNTGASARSSANSSYSASACSESTAACEGADFPHSVSLRCYRTYHPAPHPGSS